MIGVESDVIIRHSRWDKLVTEIQKDLAGKQVLVGVPSGAPTPITSVIRPNGRRSKRPARINMATLAFIQENGSVINKIPPRPFMKTTLTKNKVKIEARMRRVFNNILKEKHENAVKGLNRLALFVRGLMQDEMSTGVYQDNAPITTKGGWMRNKVSGRPFKVARKKSTRPLIDTGALRQSIIGKVV